jgi:hypothetical protein
VCHKLIDPLGLAMERYDAIGTYRDKEGANAIDDSGAIALGDPQLDGTLHGAVELAGKLVGSKAVGACVTKQVRRFAIGTRERDADACTLARLERRLADTNGNVRELMLAVVTDESFRTRPATP